MGTQCWGRTEGGGRRRGKRVHIGLWSPTPAYLRRCGSRSIVPRASCLVPRAWCLVVVKLVLLPLQCSGVASYVEHNVPNTPARARVYTRGHSSLAAHAAFRLPAHAALVPKPSLPHTSSHPLCHPQCHPLYHPLYHPLCHTQAAPSWTSPHTTSTTCGGC